MKPLTQYYISIGGRFSMNKKYTVKQTELSDDLREKRTFMSQTNPATDL